MFLYLCLYVLIDAIYTFFVAFCLCILNIYGRLVRLVRLVRCNVSTDPTTRDEMLWFPVNAANEIKKRFLQNNVVAFSDVTATWWSQKQHI